VEKIKGDPVFSGTINLWGAVDFVVGRLPAESTLRKDYPPDPNGPKTEGAKRTLYRQIWNGLHVCSVGWCDGDVLVWWLVFDLPAFTNTPDVRSAFYRAMTLLVVASPCALVLSIPSAILAAIAWGARHGVLFRGGAAIEKMADIDAVALDKTGTLTTGELAVVGYESFPPGREQEVMELAYALEAKSEHPWRARLCAMPGRAACVKLQSVNSAPLWVRA